MLLWQPSAVASMLASASASAVWHWTSASCSAAATISSTGIALLKCWWLLGWCRQWHREGVQGVRAALDGMQLGDAHRDQNC